MIHERMNGIIFFLFCYFSGEQFRSKDGLTSHKRSHSGIRPYKCQVSSNFHIFMFCVLKKL